MADLYMALIHHPVLDKQGKIVTTCVTTLDVHDLGRTARSYGMAGYYIVTPLESMQYLVRRMIGYWEEGEGARWKPTRHQAIELARLARTLEEVLSELEHPEYGPARVISTSAKPDPDTVSFEEVGRWIKQPGPAILILFGTGYGLAPEALAQAQYRLPPVRANSDYNHLAVRSAAAIIVDRLVGET